MLRGASPRFLLFFEFFLIRVLLFYADFSGNIVVFLVGLLEILRVFSFSVLF